MEQLDALVKRGRELQRLLIENPEVLEFLRIVQELKEIPVMTEKADRLIELSEAARILDTNTGTVGKYVRTGKLTAYKTIGSNHRKFWLSEVMALPERVEQEGATTA